MSTLTIINNKSYGHLEIIESLINKYSEIIGCELPLPLSIFLLLKDDVDTSFKEYIHAKYPQIKFGVPPEMDYTIHTNFYPKPDKIKYLNSNKVNPKKNFYICHRVFDSREQYPNVFFLTPLAVSNFISAHILPFNNEKKIITDVPIYVIQGNFSSTRRDYSLLKLILKHTYEYDYKIKLVGRGDIPDVALSFPEKFIICQKRNFVNYHQQFQDCYCIMTLTTRRNNKKYYKTALTSTINYALGYNLKCLIDKQLQNIYHLPDVQVYNKPRDIIQAFEKSLQYFYSKKEEGQKEPQSF